MTKRKIQDLLRRPVVVAPMGGGPSTVELVVAAAGAGAIGILAAGYKTANAMEAEIAAVRAVTSGPFGVNVFVPGAPSSDRDGIVRYLGSLAADADAVAVALGEPTWDDDGYGSKIAALLSDPPPILTFTFGCPSKDVIAAFRDAGSVVAVTVTCPEEAVVAAEVGVDALCVQGFEAGAHRGTFSNNDTTCPEYGLLGLVGEVAKVTDLPQVAAGGIMGPGELKAVLAAGAIAAQCGTAFLRCPESGAHPLHKSALVDPRFKATGLTRAFSGRPARGLINRFMLDHPKAPAAYPEINNATRPMRNAAAGNDDAQRMSLWAGQGYRSARDEPAGELIEWLCSNASV